MMSFRSAAELVARQSPLPSSAQTHEILLGFLLREDEFLALTVRSNPQLVNPNCDRWLQNEPQPWQGVDRARPDPLHEDVDRTRGNEQNGNEREHRFGCH
jgi:hypothetical protein